jgi:hypothetical protein
MEERPMRCLFAYVAMTPGGAAMAANVWPHHAAAGKRYHNVRVLLMNDAYQLLQRARR